MVELTVILVPEEVAPAAETYLLETLVVVVPVTVTILDEEVVKLPAFKLNVPTLKFPPFNTTPFEL